MCAAVLGDSDKKKNKSKSMLGVLNRIISKGTSKPMLTTDAAPTDVSPIPSNSVIPRNENIPTQLNLPHQNAQVERTHPTQMLQHNLNQTNQSLTVVERQTNLSFSHCPELQFGNVYHIGNSSKNKSNENNGDRSKKKTKTHTDVGKYPHSELTENSFKLF